MPAGAGPGEGLVLAFVGANRKFRSVGPLCEKVGCSPTVGDLI